MIRVAPSAEPITVLGIDPGTRRMGWGVVRRAGTRLIHVAHGVIAANEKLSLAERLVILERELDRVVSDHRATSASVETLFFHKDATAAAKLGHARGVALLVCARAGLAVAEYPPARVKLTVTGHGRAEKSQVAHIMRVLLSLAEAPPSDAADALALAVTHLQNTLVNSVEVPPPARRARGPRRPPLAALNELRRRLV